jgi:hypothetical protein
MALVITYGKGKLTACQGPFASLSAGCSFGALALIAVPLVSAPDSYQAAAAILGIGAYLTLVFAAADASRRTTRSSTAAGCASGNQT